MSGEQAWAQVVAAGGREAFVDAWVRAGETWAPLWQTIGQSWAGTQADFILHTSIDLSDYYMI